jgi:hypothetical protein
VATVSSHMMHTWNSVLMKEIQPISTNNILMEICDCFLYCLFIYVLSLVNQLLLSGGRGELKCSSRVGWSCSTSDTCRVTRVISYKWGKTCKYLRQVEHIRGLLFIYICIVIGEPIIIKWGPSWSWSYGSWIYSYLCNQCISPLTFFEFESQDQTKIYKKIHRKLKIEQHESLGWTQVLQQGRLFLLH